MHCSMNACMHVHPCLMHACYPCQMHACTCYHAEAWKHVHPRRMQHACICAIMQYARHVHILHECTTYMLHECTRHVYTLHAFMHTACMQNIHAARDIYVYWSPDLPTMSVHPPASLGSSEQSASCLLQQYCSRRKTVLLLPPKDAEKTMLCH